MRHEEVAAFAAGADAHVTGELAVCAGSCGPGNLHLINGLFDCHRSGLPVLAIAAQIPSSERVPLFPGDPSGISIQGVQLLLSIGRDSGADASRARDRDDPPIGHRGVAVIVLSGDVALQSGEHSSATAAYQKPAGPFIPAFGIRGDLIGLRSF